MKEVIFYLCGIFSCMIIWFLWAIIAYKKAKEAPLKEYARIHIDIEKAIRENEEQIVIAKKYQLIEDQVIDQMILQWKIELSAEPERMVIYITWRKDGGFSCTANARNVGEN